MSNYNNKILKAFRNESGYECFIVSYENIKYKVSFQYDELIDVEFYSPTQRVLLVLLEQRIMMEVIDADVFDGVMNIVDDYRCI